MRDRDSGIVAAGVELGDREIEGAGVRAAGIVIHLQPGLVGQPAGEERIDGHRWGAPLLAVIGRFFKDNHAWKATTIGTGDTGDVGRPAEVIAHPRVSTAKRIGGWGVHAGMVPGRVAVTRRKEAHQRTAVVVVAPGEQILRVGGVGRDRIFVHGFLPHRGLHVGQGAGRRGTGGQLGQRGDAATMAGRLQLAGVNGPGHQHAARQRALGQVDLGLCWAGSPDVAGQGWQRDECSHEEHNAYGDEQAREHCCEAMGVEWVHRNLPLWDQ